MKNEARKLWEFVFVSPRAVVTTLASAATFQNREPLNVASLGCERLAAERFFLIN